MQKTKSYEGLTVRVPINMARELKKLKAEKDLPSMGSALQIYIENMKIERLETRLSGLKESMQKVQKAICGLAFFELCYTSDRLVAKVQDEGMNANIRKYLENIKTGFEELDETQTIYYENICSLLEDSGKHLRK